MLIGYMRVSSESDRQTTDLQRDALLAAGVDRRHLFQDHLSGARDDRPGLKQALEFLQEGDMLVVWKLDRLGRSLVHLLQIITLSFSPPAACHLTAETLERACHVYPPAPTIVRQFESQQARHDVAKGML